MNILKVNLKSVLIFLIIKEKWYVVILFFVLFFYNCSEKGNPVTSIFPAEGIVFSSNRDGHSQIYRMALDGSDQINLSQNIIEEYSAQILPNSEKIIFGNKFENASQIWSMNLDGSDRTNLATNNPPNKNSMSFICSPNGEKIAFVRNGWDIFIMNSTGNELYKLTSGGWTREFSPDGETIIFEFDFAINTINTAGGTTNILTQGGGPTYSPDGNLIAYTDLWDDLWIMNADGSNQTQLTNTEVVYEARPYFLPDGKNIIYGHYYGSRLSEIVKINIETLDISDIIVGVTTNNVVTDISKDGSTILFSTDRDGNDQIYSMDKNGGNVINLSNNPYDEFGARFFGN